MQYLVRGVWPRKSIQCNVIHQRVLGLNHACRSHVNFIANALNLLRSISIEEYEPSTDFVQLHSIESRKIIPIHRNGSYFMQDASTKTVDATIYL